MDKGKYKMKKELGGNVLKFLFFGLCLYGIVRISIWSYFQTQAFFAPFDALAGVGGSAIISNALAMIFQYGQNVALFMVAIESAKITAYNNKLNESRNENHRVILGEEINSSNIKKIIYYVLFGVFAIVDAGTNVGEFLKDTAVGQGTLFVSLGVIICLVVVFIEEIATDTVNAILHAFNDILESFGINRVLALDSFVDPERILATRMNERFGNTGPHKPQNRPEPKFRNDTKASPVRSDKFPSLNSDKDPRDILRERMKMISKKNNPDTDFLKEEDE